MVASMITTTNVQEPQAVNASGTSAAGTAPTGVRGAASGGGKKGGGGRGGRGRGRGQVQGQQGQGQGQGQQGQGYRQGATRDTRPRKGRTQFQPQAQSQAQRRQVESGSEATLGLTTDDKEKEKEMQAAGEGEDSESEGAVCWICAEPVMYYSVSACNHRTCHVCALRLRALYKRMDCTFCKEPQQCVVFTTSLERPYAEYDLNGIPHRDTKLSIYFETQEMMEETLILLRFNCPDPDCDYIGNGWGDLKLHTRAVHNRLICDLCIRNKKVFAHEHALYPLNVLPIHLPSMYQRHRVNNVSKDQVEGGVHPFCEFCHECFFGDDELYAHCRERHEECFICKRNDIHNQYFLDYDSLERHFSEAHHPCNQPQCLAHKFVVFGSMIDLKAHMVDEHGGDMTSRDRKDARRVVADFAFEELGGRHGHGRREYHEREREREPPPRQQPTTQTRRQAFGARLTVDEALPTGELPAAAASQAAVEVNRTSTPMRDDVDPIVAERHSALISRLQYFAANPTTAVPAVKAAIRGYRSSESSARDLISTVWNILDRNLENTASIINAFVDLLEEEEKKQDLLASWNGFAIEQRRQFPELVPTAVGGNYDAIATGRVLNAKHSTKARSSRRSSRAVWDRVAQAAGSSSSTPSTSTSAAAASFSTHFPALERFPPLHSSSTSSGPAIRPSPPPNQRTTPWTSSTVAAAAPSSAQYRPVEAKIQVVAAPSRSSSSPSKRSQRPPKLSATQFPELPSSSASKPKVPVSGNPSLRNILGTSSFSPAVTAWQASTSGSVNAVSSGGAEGSVVDGEGGGEGMENVNVVTQEGKGKKSKGKQKQTLFTLGSFPT